VSTTSPTPPRSACQRVVGVARASCPLGDVSDDLNGRPQPRVSYSAPMVEMVSGGFEGAIVHQDGCVVVALSGDMDLASTMPFSVLAEQAVSASHHVVFDMGGVTFLDSTGLRGILHVYRTVSGDGSVTLRNVSPAIVHVLHVSGVETLLNVEHAQP
jgi:anti-sigma B factor antagonist